MIEDRIYDRFPDLGHTQHTWLIVREEKELPNPIRETLFGDVAIDKWPSAALSQCRGGSVRVRGRAASFLPRKARGGTSAGADRAALYTTTCA